MILSAHQPQYLPYLGFWDKLSKSDVYVLLDDVTAHRSDFTNRNKIKVPTGWMWLTVPVSKKNGVIINQIKIADNVNWGEKHWHALEHSYSKAPYFRQHSDFFKKIYKMRWERLVDLDEVLLKSVAKQLDIEIPFFKSSQLNAKGEGTERLISICKKLGADTYLSGSGGKNYLNEKMFEKEKIKLIYQNFQHPIYKQCFEGFIHNLSIVDYLFCVGGQNFESFSGR